MKAPFARSLAALAMGLLAACATPSATDIKGRWKPVNRYGHAPEAIPLQQAYLYYASPMDVTLKSLLTRWARDSRRTLSYLHPSDFTLHAPAAEIRTPDLGEAVMQLSSAYAAQGVAITSDGSQIVVRASGSGVADAGLGGPGEPAGSR